MTTDRIRQARRRLNSALIAVEPLLTNPYPDDPRWTPWTRFVGPALKELKAALDEQPAAVPVPAGTDLREQVLHGLDFAYCNGIGYETPEKLLAAYDASRAAMLSASERQFLTFALELAADQMAARSDEFDADDEAALAKLRRMADEAQQAEPEAPITLATPCTACTHTRNWHDSDTGACLVCTGLAEQCGCHGFTTEEPGQ